MKTILAAATLCSAILSVWALPAQAQAMQTPQGGPNSPPLKCADYKRNSDGSWAPTHEVSIVFPDGTSLTVAPSVTFPAGNATHMGLPMSLLLDTQCNK